MNRLSVERIQEKKWKKQRICLQLTKLIKLTTADVSYPTCPVEVSASDDWLPAHTFLMNIPWRASTTFGL